MQIRVALGEVVAYGVLDFPRSSSLAGTDGSGFSLLHTFAGGIGSSTDGGYPFGSLIQSGSTLYGTTAWGGSSDAGTVFKVATDGTGFSIVHSFPYSAGTPTLAKLN